MAVDSDRSSALALREWVLRVDGQGNIPGLGRVRTRWSVGFDKPLPVGGTIRIDPIPQPVNDYVMVEPTQR
jgi:hypothetical protein